MKLFIKWIFLALVLLGIASIIPGIKVASFYSAIITVAVIAIINLFIKPLLTLLTLPVTLLTFGLFSLVINALLFYFSATIVKGFEVEGFVPALIGAFLYSLASSLINYTFKN